MPDQAGFPVTPQEWFEALRVSVHRCLKLVEDLSDDQWAVPQRSDVNPFLWEIGHVTWFVELWTLREIFEREPYWKQGDSWYHSSDVAHGKRWELDLPTREQTLTFAKAVLDRLGHEIEQAPLRSAPNPIGEDRLKYFLCLSTFHAEMHAEAFVMMRQTLGYPGSPILKPKRPQTEGTGRAFRMRDDVTQPGGGSRIGRVLEAPFVFDNEGSRYEVAVAPFRMSPMATTQKEFLGFVNDRGYERPELWSEEGRDWLRESQATAPIYWRHDGASWQQRMGDEWHPLQENDPVVHVCWHEAQAYCRWANRRLPTEAEWTHAARHNSTRSRFPWGDHRNEDLIMDLRYGGVVEASRHTIPDESYHQLIGNVWEWTSSSFEPFPGFEPGPYRDYSLPWFGTRKVLKGGSFASSSLYVESGTRNFFPPDRRDVIAGFRTCALSD